MLVASVVGNANAWCRRSSMLYLTLYCACQLTSWCHSVCVQILRRRYCFSGVCPCVCLSVCRAKV